MKVGAGPGTPGGQMSISRWATPDSVQRLLETRMKPEQDGPHITVRRTTNTFVAEVTSYDVVWESTLFEWPSGGWTVTSFNIYFPYDGIYYCQADMDFASDDRGYHQTRIYKNGSIPVGHVYEGVIDESETNVIAIVDANKGDRIKVRTLRDSVDNGGFTIEECTCRIVRLAR